MTKRKIFIILLITVLILISMLFVGCHKVKTLINCDFSIDNIVEMRYSSSPYYESLKGNIYAIDRQSGEEEKFAKMASAWEKLQSQEFLIGEMLIPTIETGGTTYYECKFKDGSCIKIKKDANKNIFFNDGKRSYRIKNYDAMLEFNDACRIIADPSLRYLVGYLDPDIPEELPS